MLEALKTIYQKFYSFGLATEQEFHDRQKAIRLAEWNDVSAFIPNNSSFLDIGCGKGYSMSLAITHKGCDCIGVDPFPNFAGVAPELHDLSHKFKIMEGWAEDLPFESDSFDVVYSSHMLEHTSDYSKVLSEMNRVVKPDGIVIMGVPTATMASIRLITIGLLSTHRNILEILRWAFRSKDWKKEHPISSFIIPASHGQSDKTILYDLWDYRVSLWKSRVQNRLALKHTIFPALYSYPDFIQLFRLRKMKSWSSSVFFIAGKKLDSTH